MQLKKCFVMPRVSVIIPNYNHFHYLKQRIDLILNQTYSDFEIIILDDCSTDKSYEIIESYRYNAKVSSIHYNEKNSGSPFYQWVKGICLSKGEYIWIAESDDWCEIDYLKHIMDYADKFPSANLLYSDTILVKNNIIPSWKKKDNREFVFFKNNQLLKEKLINGLQINNASAVVFKKSVALKHLEALKRFRKHGDYFFWIQIAKEGDGVFVNLPLNYCRILENSVTRLSWNKDVDSLREQIAIFGLLKSYSKILSIRQQFFFYDCWGLSFLQKFSDVKGIDLFKFYYKLLIENNFNFYFTLRFFYFKGMKALERFKLFH